jgi:hypothetical protein
MLAHSHTLSLSLTHALHLSLFHTYSKGIYDELGEFETAQLCLETAKHLSPNVAKQCMISATIAELHDRMVS